MRIKNRLTNHKDVLSGFQALFSVDDEDSEVIQCFKNTCDFYGEDLCNTTSDILTELTMWREKMKSSMLPPSCAISALKMCNIDIYPNIHRLLEILATLPVSTATPERTFSSLKRIKTYLRNTTGQVTRI